MEPASIGVSAPLEQCEVRPDQACDVPREEDGGQSSFRRSEKLYLLGLIVAGLGLIVLAFFKPKVTIPPATAWVAISMRTPRWSSPISDPARDSAWK